MTNDHDSADSFQRWLGMFFLAISFAMMIWGQVVLSATLSGVAFAVYWTACFGFSFAAVVMGFLEVRRLLREVRAERISSMRRTMRGIKRPQEHADGCVTEK